MKKIKLSLDAMGGDYAPEIVVEGATEAKLRYPNIDFIFFGDKNFLEPLINSKKNLSDSQIIHTVEFIKPNDKPSNVIRRGANTSMALAIKSVRNHTNAMVSAGNTGALMAFSKLFLKTISGINRPAIAACFPTKKGEVCMLDLGANIECDKNNLIQFALMGQAFAKIVIGIKNPKVSLLNIGEEEIKGWGFREFNKKHRLEAIERDPIWVVECNKAIEGYAHLRLFEKEGEKRAHILALYLTRVIVGRGIGTNLTNLMLEGAKRYRAKAISLESTLTAHAFYSRFGFKDSSALMKMEINGYPVSYFPMAMDL